MHKKLIAFLSLYVFISFHLWAQCDSEVEFINPYRFTKNASFQEDFSKVHQNGHLYEIIFFNDIFIAGDSLYKGDPEPKLLNYSNFALICTDSFGQKVWTRNYAINTIQFPKFFISRSVFYLQGDFLHLLCLLDSGSYSLPNDSLKLEKRALLLFQFSTVNGAMASHKVLVKAMNKEMFNVATLPAITFSPKDNDIHMALALSDSILMGDSLLIPEDLGRNELLMMRWRADGELGLFSRIAWSQKRFGQNSMDVVSLDLHGEDFIVTGTFSEPLNLKSGKILYSDSTIKARDIYVIRSDRESYVSSKAISIGGPGSEQIVSVQSMPNLDLMLLLNSSSFELRIDQKVQIPSFVNSYNIVKLDEDLAFEKSSLLRPANESIILDSKFIPHLSLDINENLMLQVGLFDEGMYFDGSLLKPRSSGMTFYHFHFDGNLIPFKKNVFWSSNPFIINMIDEWDGKALYRGICSDTIFGSALIPYSPPYNMVFHMQKCMKNILQTPEMSLGETSGWYPNPFTNVLYVPEWLQNKQTTILDMSGKIMYQGVPAQSSISASDWSKGMYLLKIEGHKVQKLIKP